MSWTQNDKRKAKKMKESSAKKVWNDSTESILEFGASSLGLSRTAADAEGQLR